MKNDVIKGMKIARYGLDLKMNIVFLVGFIIFGGFWEISAAISGIEDPLLSVFNAGDIFLFVAAMFPAQLLISVDLAEFVQASSYKKRIQTTMFTKVSLIGFLIALTLIIALKGTGCLIAHKDMGQVLGQLYVTVIIGVIIMLYSAVAYKHFIPTVIMLFVLAVLLGMMANMIGRYQQFFTMNPIVSVLVSYGMILLGGLLHWLIARGFYKHEISKMAFGASLKRGMGYK